MALLRRFNSRIRKSPLLKRISKRRATPAPRPMPAPRNSGIVSPTLPRRFRLRPVVKPAPAPVVNPAPRPMPTPRNSGIVSPTLPRRFRLRPVVKPAAAPAVMPVVNPAPRPMPTPRNSGIVPPSLPRSFQPLKPVVISPAVIKPAIKPVIKTADINPTDPWNCGIECNKPTPVKTPVTPVKTSTTPGPIEPKESTIDPAETLLEAQEKGISPDLLKPQKSAKTAGGSGIFLGLMALVGGGYFLFGGKEKGSSKKASLNGPSDASKSTKHLKMNL
jgi:hypothetical protein